MESSSPNTTSTLNLDFSPYFRVVNGQIERFHSPVSTPPSDDPLTGVVSKDVVVSPDSGVSVRLYLPKTTDPDKKLPLLLYTHGGAFCLGSPSSPPFHNFVTSLVAGARIVAVSVDYRLAPEHPLPIAYDDSWTALQWVVSHLDRNGPEPWLNRHADFDRVFLGGESAGANIANHLAIRVGSSAGQCSGIKVVGMFLVHPYFGGKGVVEEMYKFMCPTSSGGEDDPRLNPVVDPNLPRMGCERVLFCVAERDGLRERGWAYYEALGKSGWGGKREIVETEGEGHGFHLFDPTCEKAVALVNRVVCFLKET